MDVNSVIVEGKVSEGAKVLLEISDSKGSNVYLPVTIGPECGVRLRIVGRLREKPGESMYVSAEYVEVLK